MNWSPQNLTAVIFITPTPVVGSAFDTYRAIVGHAPKTSNETQPPSGTVSNASGPVDLGMLTITLQPGRIDIVLSPISDMRKPHLTPPVFPDLGAATQAVLGYAKKVSADLDPVRVALIANLIQPAGTKEDAVRLFREATGISSVPDAALDLQFGFNVRKSFGSAGWEMNRLCNCGIGKLQWMQMQIGPSGPSQSVVEGAYFTTLMADVNTVLRPNVSLGSTLATNTFDDLAHELKKVISGGYDYLTSS